MVNETLESLHIWGNLITDMGMEVILTVLERHNNTINDIQIFGNIIESYEDLNEKLSLLCKQNQLYGRKDIKLAAEDEALEEEINKILAADDAQSTTRQRANSV